MTIQKIDATSPEAQSADLKAQNIAKLRELFPELLTERIMDGKTEATINVDTLKALVGDQIVTDAEERYGLNWHGKRRARQLALTPSTGTLRPCPEESVDWDTTKNLMIEGDNLEVLKLLQKSYANKVKLIYIDPPYNTGKDFIYPDNFQDSIKAYLEITNQIDRGIKLSSNTDASGRFHTDWLNMMYPRLKLAHSLLKVDGAILISIDDSEVSNVRFLADEIFGPENFIGQIVWQRSKKGDSKLIASVHEYIVCYGKSKSSIIENGPWRKPKDGADKVLAKYEEFKLECNGNHDLIRNAMQNWYRSLADSDPCKAHKHYSWSDDRGLYFPDNFAGPDDGRESRPRHEIYHPVTGKPCKKPSTGWRWDEDKTNWALSQNPPRIHFGLDESTIPNRKSYLFEIDSEPFSSVFYRDGRSATLEVESLIGKGWFPFPKNTEVLVELIELMTNPGDIVLDFFAGSGSTGHAVFIAGVNSKPSRRFFLVQLPEPTHKNGYSTISDITKARLRSAGEKIKSDNPMFSSDTGFRVFKLNTSNLRAWNPYRENFEANLLDNIDHIDATRTGSDLLFEVLLKRGLDLCVPIESRTIAGKAVESVGVGVLMVCLAEEIKLPDVEELALGIAKWRQELVTAGETVAIFRDSAFADDVVKSNLAAILEQNGVKTVRSL